ncbi:hypothetical protein [Actinacidiphila acididurans]|uniref:PASTA domain-containing protein n=1 Tax=Actinacidiphila acididurans TaxID=2784346 RepID=A0ABS2TTS4_9ACTN|nr:hypothetical protein [Actinacidiphila acididurans]MBM9505343.1 hypothetical protein [Actinacidiphila acididurans]
MSSQSSRPSAGTGYSPFEQELVNAMNDFASGSDAPHFDTAAIARGARRKRATAVAGIAAALVVVGGGTALAAGAVGGSHAARPAAAATSTAGADGTTVLYGSSNGKTVTLPLAGVSSTGARAALVKLRLTPDFSRTPVAGCKQATVVAVSPHAPTVVHAGDTVHVTVCAG